MISNEKYSTLNLSKKPNFIYTFLVKSYTTFIGPNFIGKVAQKTTLLLHRHDIRTRHHVLTFFPRSQSYSVTCYYNIVQKDSCFKCSMKLKKEFHTYIFQIFNRRSLCPTVICFIISLLRCLVFLW